MQPHLDSRTAAHTHRHRHRNTYRHPTHKHHQKKAAGTDHTTHAFCCARANFVSRRMEVDLTGKCSQQ
eukprot:5595395-Alexandrium_andersonii.AAC.1